MARSENDEAIFFFFRSAGDCSAPLAMTISAQRRRIQLATRGSQDRAFVNLQTFIEPSFS